METAETKAQDVTSTPSVGAPGDETVLMFLHVPKTGGMTLEQVIECQYPGAPRIFCRSSDRSRLRTCCK